MSAYLGASSVIIAEHITSQLSDPEQRPGASPDQTKSEHCSDKNSAGEGMWNVEGEREPALASRKPEPESPTPAGHGIELPEALHPLGLWTAHQATVPLDGDFVGGHSMQRATNNCQASADNQRKQPYSVGPLLALLVRRRRSYGGVYSNMIFCVNVSSKS
jgi:hypothetical protein